MKKITFAERSIRDVSMEKKMNHLSAVSNSSFRRKELTSVLLDGLKLGPKLIIFGEKPVMDDL